MAHKQGDRWAVGAHEIQAVGASLEQVGLTQAADKLLVLRQGRLVAIGTPDELRDPLRARRIDMTSAPP